MLTNYYYYGRNNIIGIVMNLVNKMPGEVKIIVLKDHVSKFIMLAVGNIML